MAENYMLDFMRGYKFVDDIDRQKRLDEENKVERDRRFGLMNSAEKRAATTYDQEQEDRTASRGVVNAKKDAFLGLGQAEAKPAPPARDDVYAAWSLNLEEMGVKTGTPEFQQAFSKTKPLIDDPGAAGTALALSDEINKYLDKGSLAPNKLITDYVNIVGAGELAQRGGEDGLTRNVKHFIPNQSGDGFHANLLVKGADGKEYEAPATEGKSADPKDNVVQNFTMDQMVKWYGGSRAALQMIIEAEAKAGKSDTIDAYRAAVQKHTADRQARADSISDYTRKKEIDQKYEKQPPVPIGKYGLYDPKSGKKIVGAAAGGGSGGPGAGKGKWIMGDDGEWEFLQVGEKGQGLGKQHVKQNDDGTTSVYDETTKQSRIIYTPEAAMQKATAMAQAEADAIGSEWTFLQPSAEKTNAEKTNARAKEIYAELMGGEQKPAGNNPPAANKFSPGQILKQGGKTFVVDSSGVPQEKGAKEQAPKQDKPQRGAQESDKSNMSPDQKNATNKARGGYGIAPLPVPNKSLAGGIEANNAKVLAGAAETREKVRASRASKEKTAEEKELARLSEIANTLKEKKARGALSTGKDQADYEKAISLGLITEPTPRR